MSVAEAQRLACFVLTPLQLQVLIAGEVEKTDLPEGFRVVYFGHDASPLHRGVYVILSHPDFDKVPEGEAIPVRVVRWWRKDGKD